LAAKIKFKRIGKKKKPSYRVVILDEASATKGRTIDEVGFYNPQSEPKFEFNKEKVLSWISKGAKPTESVRVILGRAGILPAISFEGKKKRAPKQKGEAAVEGAAAAAPAPAAPAAEAKK